jgi:hypothetical protein
MLPVSNELAGIFRKTFVDLQERTEKHYEKRLSGELDPEFEHGKKKNARETR